MGGFSRLRYHAGAVTLWGVPMPDEIKAVLSDDLKRPFMLIVAIFVVVAGGFTFSRWVETYIDGRIESKMAVSRGQAEDQEKRIATLEAQMREMRDLLIEIKVDVKYLRSRNGRDLLDPPRLQNSADVGGKSVSP